jgi:proline iminopeptidase
VPSTLTPHDSGLLDVGDGQSVHWEVCGNPAGKPALVVHGGPGSGATPWWTQFFDPARYRVVLFDQRGCGRSLPHASEPGIDLSVNTTAHLIADMEALRRMLGIERWLLLGGSWGSALSLAYAVEHPEQVSELVLWSVVTTRPYEVEWVTRTMGHLYPAEHEQLLSLLPASERDGNIAAAYHRLLMSPDPAVHDAAARAWCAWEDRLATLSGPVQPSERYADPRFRLAFARLVTHYFGNAGFLDDDAILGRLGRLSGVPTVLVRGRLDVASPLSAAWAVARAMPWAELHVVEQDPHGPGDETLDLLHRSIARFAGR